MTLSALDSMPGRITFQPLTEADLSTLAEWLTRPHIAQWWGDCRSLDEVREQCLPHSGDDSGVASYLAYQDGVRIGYIQSYVAISAGGGWWPEEHHPGVRGIDQFLADGQRLGKGLGTEMVRQFVEFLFEDPAVTRIQADPSPANLRAIRCYEKAGFRQVGPITTPDGPAILMMTERPVNR